MALLLLDLDNTIADRDAAFRHWMDAKLTTWAPEDDGDDRRRLLEWDADGVRPRHDFLARVRNRYGLDETVEELLAEYRRLTLEGFPPIPADVRRQIERLRGEGWSVAVVTNGEDGVQQATVEAVGLARLVDACVVSGAVGVRKPDPRIFSLAAERCHESLDGAWMVGDGEADVEGASRAGLDSVWLDRGRTWTRTDVVPSVVAPDLHSALVHVGAVSP